MAISSAPHPFTLRQLQYAVAVADALSFGRAAARCHVSQPSLSAQVAQLETAIGLPLFERDRRTVRLTVAGQGWVDRARQVLVGADELWQAARQAQDPLAGTLRIGVIPTVSPYLLPAVAPALRAAFPRLSLRWVEDKTQALVRGLSEGALEAAVVAQEAELGRVEAAPLARDPFLLATARGHPLGTGRGSVPSRSLRGEDVLLLDEGHCFRDQALAFCGRARTRELEYRATSLSTLAQMVASGAGVTLLPALSVPTEAARAQLKVRRLAEPIPFRTLALVWRPSSPLGDALRQLASALQRAWPTPTGRAAPR
jgi:LysR family transcriptional regulator, hydrogen peroxide-inducible genes activator